MITTEQPSKAKEEKGIRIPHVWTIILFCLILAGVMHVVALRYLQQYPIGVGHQIEQMTTQIGRASCRERV